MQVAKGKSKGSSKGAGLSSYLPLMLYSRVMAACRRLRRVAQPHRVVSCQGRRQLFVWPRGKPWFSSLALATCQRPWVIYTLGPRVITYITRAQLQLRLLPDVIHLQYRQDLPATLATMANDGLISRLLRRCLSLQLRCHLPNVIILLTLRRLAWSR